MMNWSELSLIPSGTVKQTSNNSDAFKQLNKVVNDEWCCSDDASAKLITK